VLDIHELSPITDYFVLASADNTRLLRTVADRVREALREEGIRPLRVEGLPEHGWIVLDYGDMIVHLLTNEQREYYRLEDLWSEAHRLLVIQ
jgi:ribosome-associated protein